MTKERVMKIIILWIVFLALFLLVAIPPAELLVELLIIGSIATLIVAIALSGFLVFDPRKVLDPKRFFHLGILILYYLIMEIKSHATVAKAILDPHAKVTAAIVPVRARGGTLVLMVLAHLITNTPGTVAIDLEGDRAEGVLYIHWLNPTTLDEKAAKSEILKELERLAINVFG